MALNDINLTADNLEKIYGTVLLGSDDKVITENSDETSNNNSKFLGSNLKSVVLLVNQPAATILLDEELDFLTSILSACGYTLADVAIVNCANKKNELFDELKSSLSIKSMIFFNVSMSSVGLPLNIPHYQVQAYDNLKLLAAPDLITIKNNKTEKNGLWLSLKKLFEIK